MPKSATRIVWAVITKVRVPGAMVIPDAYVLQVVGGGYITPDADVSPDLAAARTFTGATYAAEAAAFVAEYEGLHLTTF